MGTNKQPAIAQPAIAQPSIAQPGIALTDSELDNIAGGTETITFEYGSLAIHYVQQSADGGGAGTAAPKK